MYEDTEKNVDWKSIIKKVVMVIVVIVAILGLVTLVKKCTKSDDKPNKPTPTTVNLTKQLDELEEATLKYLTVDNLPSTVNSSKTIRLKILINREIISGITDDAGNACDTSSSYAEVTKLDNNYAVKLSLTCGSNSDYRIIYVGCFENCEGSICKGEETSTNGICELKTVEPTPDDTTSNPNNTSTNTNANTTKPSVTKPNTSTNTNTNATTKPNTNNNSTNNNNNSNTVKTVTEYEYKKCKQENYCVTGTLINGQCAIQENITLQGKVLKLGGTSTKVLGNATPKTSTTKDSSTPATFERTVDVKPSETYTIKNTTSVAYKSMGMTSTGTIRYAKYTCSKGTIKDVNGTYKCEIEKTNTTYSCTVGDPQNINGVYKCVTTVNDPVTYKCENPSYTYNKSNNTCTLTTVSTRYSRPSVMTTSSCETTWSRSTYLSGWTRTGNTRTVRE